VQITITKPMFTQANVDSCLLDGLAERELKILRPHLQEVELAQGAVLYLPDKPIGHVYFPRGAVFSRAVVMDDGTLVEVAMIGNEGMVGTAVVMGARAAQDKAFCQVAGKAYRIEVGEFLRLTGQLPGLRRRITHFVQALVVQFTQSVACNRLHTVEQRCARWLLMTQDRVGRDRFPVTQLFLAAMLGSRRAGVSEVMGRLRRDGLVRYTRGVVTILDRRGLQRVSCECYEVVARRTRRLLGSQ
jgi:CRP-like cAMP-binding protein